MLYDDESIQVIKDVSEGKSSINIELTTCEIIIVTNYMNCFLVSRLGYSSLLKKMKILAISKLLAE